MTGAGDIKARIAEAARAGGFDQVRFTVPALSADTQRRFAEFLTLGRHGEMGWMEANAERRADPTVLWPGARSVIILTVNYGPAENPLDHLDARERGIISVYARNQDYHDIVKKRLKHLGGWIAQEFSAEVKIFIDTAPVLEKPLAQQAGLGWQGKHTNLVSRDYGSWLFLAEIFTTLDLPPDAAEEDHCGACRRCLDICPTAAFPAPYQLDARRCISYLTIEHKGPIPVEFRAAMGNRIYGCDDCLAVCPWNKFAQRTGDYAFLPRAELTLPRLIDLAQLTDADFRRVFAGSPIKRIGRDRFVRNVLIAVGNSGDTHALPVVENLLRDDSPLVRGAAVWALKRLASEENFARLQADYFPTESDDMVRWEWNVTVSGSSAAELQQ